MSSHIIHGLFAQIESLDPYFIDERRREHLKCRGDIDMPCILDYSSMGVFEPNVLMLAWRFWEGKSGLRRKFFVVNHNIKMLSTNLLYTRNARPSRSEQANNSLFHENCEDSRCELDGISVSNGTPTVVQQWWVTHKQSFPSGIQIVCRHQKLQAQLSRDVDIGNICLVLVHLVIYEVFTYFLKNDATGKEQSSQKLRIEKRDEEERLT